jgi:hypothetical protein
VFVFLFLDFSPFVNVNEDVENERILELNDHPIVHEYLAISAEESLASHLSNPTPMIITKTELTVTNATSQGPLLYLVHPARTVHHRMLLRIIIRK